MLEHTPGWLSRKYHQALKMQWESDQRETLNTFRALVLLMDGIFNKGRRFSDFMPESFEEVVNQQKERNNRDSQFVQGAWWKAETEE